MITSLLLVQYIDSFIYFIIIFTYLYNRKIKKKRKMGQQPIKGYSIEGEAIGAGTNRFWKVYNGIKQGSNMPVTIFIVEKKSIKKN